MLGKDEKLLFSSTCIMDNYINLYKGYDSSHEIYCFHLQKHTKIREWDNSQKKSDYCPIFFILGHTKSTQPCMIQVLKQKSKECALCLKIIPSTKQLYH